jgi:hypothetical protein
MSEFMEDMWWDAVDDDLSNDDEAEAYGYYAEDTWSDAEDDES